MILFTGENVLHSTYWNYFNCNKLCDGNEIDYYQNGNIRTQGDYVDGKPIYIFEYNEEGIIEVKTWYKIGTMNLLRVEYFDETGNLKEYEIHKLKRAKKKTKIKVYSPDGKLINKKVE